jgi:hypothetical protein
MKAHLTLDETQEALATIGYRRLLMEDNLPQPTRWMLNPANLRLAHLVPCQMMVRVSFRPIPYLDLVRRVMTRFTAAGIADDRAMRLALRQLARLGVQRAAQELEDLYGKT